MRRARQWAIILVVFTVVFSMFGGTALGASTRFALVTDVTGTVKVTKAGGTKEIRVFDGMGLNEGDKLKVEKGSSVTLKVADREDEVVLGENWNGTLSKLKSNSSGGGDTAVKTWAGSMYNKVEKITGSSSTYKVETPTAVMGVRGTHFTVLIDPITGLPTMFVSAGRVAASDTNERSSVVVLPTQQVTAYPGVHPSAGVEYVKPEQLVKIADDEVIAALLRNKQQIDEENQEILEGIAQEEGTLDLSEAEELEKYKSNVENALFNFMKTALDTGAIPEEEIENIIRTANQSISDGQRQYDLNREVPPINQTAGVDPAAAAERQRQLQQAEQKKQQQVQQKEEKKQEIATNFGQVLQQVVQQVQQQQQANQQAQQQKQQEAADRLLDQLTAAQRQALEQRLEEKKQQQQQQETRRDNGTQQPTQQTGGTGNSGGGSTTQPVSITVTSNKTDVVYGDSVTLTANLVISFTTTPVPNDVEVTFNKQVGSARTAIGKVKTADGKAVLTLSGADMQKLDIGSNWISVNYPGTSTTQSSNSVAKEVKVAKSKTKVALEPSTPSAPGNTVTFTASVQEDDLGTVQPEGYVKLMNGAQELDRQLINPATGKATLTASFANAGSYKLTAVYEGSNYFAGSTSAEMTHEVKLTQQTLKLSKVNGTATNTFNLEIRLDNFVAPSEVYGAQIHFLSNQNLTFLSASDAKHTYFNDDKFADFDHTAEILKKQDGTVTVNGTPVPKRETIYALTLFGTGTAVAFDGDALFATIPFQYSGSGSLEIVHIQFVDKNGAPIVVEDLSTTIAY